MSEHIKGIFEPILTFLFILLLVDFLLFLRAWSLYDFTIKRILKVILVLDACFAASAIFIAIMANLPDIITFVNEFFIN